MLGSIGVIAAALFFGVIGVSAFMRPHNLLNDFDLLAETSVGRNEVRGIYGGFPLAVAGLLLFSLTGSAFSNGILLALAGCSLGMALGRLASALIDRKLDCHPAIWMVLELIVAGLIASGINAS